MEYLVERFLELFPREKLALQGGIAFPVYYYMYLELLCRHHVSAALTSFSC